MSKAFDRVAVAVIVIFFPEIMACAGIGPQSAWGNTLLTAVQVATLVALSCWLIHCFRKELKKQKKDVA